MPVMTTPQRAELVRCGVTLTPQRVEIDDDVPIRRVDNNNNILSCIAINDDLCRAVNNCNWKKLVAYFSSFEKYQLMAMYDRAIGCAMFEVAQAIMVYLECGNNVKSCEFIFNGVKGVHQIWFEHLISEHIYNFNRIDQLFKHLSPLELSIHVVSVCSRNYELASLLMFKYILDRCVQNKCLGISYNRTMLSMNKNKTFGVELTDLLPYLTTACKEKLYAGFVDGPDGVILVQLKQSFIKPPSPCVVPQPQSHAVVTQRNLEVFDTLITTFTPNTIGKNISGLSKLMVEVITDPMTAWANLNAGIVSDAEIQHIVGTGFDVISWLCANEVIKCDVTSTDLIMKLIALCPCCCNNRIYVDKEMVETCYSPLILAIDFCDTKTIVEKVTAMINAYDWANSGLSVKNFLCALYSTNKRHDDRWKNNRDVMDTIVKLLFERRVLKISLADYFELKKYADVYIEQLLSFGIGSGTSSGTSSQCK